ncbi:restriction endonuclease subunit S [Vibrio pomeroyi]|uniref:Restriction endonuclease subunit S n=1 Tax=Vibrio pomeroyi TaxID=198832 RepID=A0ABV4N298_9VIBR
MSVEQTSMNQLITDNIDVWTSTVKTKSASGRGISKKRELYGVKKLRELILELAVRGKLVPQDLSDESVSVMLERIAEEKAQLVNKKKLKKQKELPAISDDELPYSIPKNWVWCRLDDICFGITSGSTPPKSNFNESEGIPYLKVYNIRDQKVDFDYKPQFVDLECHATKLKRSSLYPGDVIMNIVGPPLGKVAIIPNDYPEWNCNQAITFFRPIEPSLNTYIYTYLRAGTFLRSIDLIGTAGQDNISVTKSRSILLPTPPLEEQHRIVAKVDELMTLCDQLEQQTEASIEAHQTLVEVLLNTLTSSENADELIQNWTRISEHFDTLFITEASIDQLKQTILQLAVMGKLVPQDSNDEPAAKLLERIAEEKAQLIKDKKIKKSQSTDSIIEDNCDWTLSEGWDCAELQELCRFIDYRGKNPKKSDHGVRLITAKNVRNGYIKNDPVEYISEELYEQWMVRGLPKKRDILFITEGHTMGYVAQVDLGYLFALAQRTICLQSIGDLSPEYLRIVLMSPQFQLMVKDNETGSAAGGIKASKLKRLPIPIPTLREQKIIAERVDCLLAICEQLKVQLKESQVIQLHLTDAIVEQCNPM